MRVAIYDNKNKKEIENKNYDLIIFLEDEIDYLNGEKVDKNKILKFLDYLYEKISHFVYIIIGFSVDIRPNTQSPFGKP